MDTRANSSSTRNRINRATPPPSVAPEQCAGLDAAFARDRVEERPEWGRTIGADPQNALEVSRKLFAHINPIAIQKKYPRTAPMQKLLDELRDACIACAEPGRAAKKFVAVVQAAGIRIKWTPRENLDCVSIQGPWMLSEYTFDRVAPIGGRRVVPVNELGHEFEGDGEVGNG